LSKLTPVSTSHPPQEVNTAHLEPALIGTASLTFSINVFPDELAGAAFLLPPVAAYPMAPTENRVASVRYSFLIARPNMTLRFKSQLSDKLQDIIDEGTYYDMARGSVEVESVSLRRERI
jgi:hypothetical protein